MTVIGIDLGTANSCVAAVIDGRPQILADEQGRRTTPSIFAMDATGKNLFGVDAEHQQSMNPMGTIFAVKRLIGLKYDSDEVQFAKTKLPYEIIRADNGDAWVAIEEQPYSPEEISSKILTRMREIAEHNLGGKVKRAVITVPAHFNDSQRQATRDAGRIAGLDVMRIINEPTAAALAYGMDDDLVLDEKGENPSRTIAVFDLGGGTFDVSILEMDQGVFDVLATHGDTYLGGEDFDYEIVRYLVERGRRELGVDLEKDYRAMQRLKVVAEKAKIELSDQYEANIDLPNISQGNVGLHVVLSRKDMERIVSPVIARVEKPCLAAMADANLIASDITDVVLVGGMTKMPAVRKHCERVFKSIPHTGIDPDEAVALGAAIQAALIDGLIGGVEFIDVLPLSLGIEIPGGKVEPIVPRNTKVPAQVTKIFTTSSPLQSQLSVHIVQGESNFAPENKSLGRFEMVGIPPAPRGWPEIAVSFNVDEGGMVAVTARDLDTGDECKMELVASSGLDDKELDELIRKSKLQQEQKERVSQRISGEQRESSQAELSNLDTLRKELKDLIYMMRFRLDEEGAEYRGAKRREAEDTLKQARQALAVSKNEKELKGAIGTLKEEERKFEDFISTPW